MQNKQGSKLYFFLPAILLIVLLSLTACNTGTTGNIPYASIPAGKGYADGQEIYFSHTEASDPAIAEKLTKMMKSPVLYVPSLGKATDDMLASVYVFENGVSGKGPAGFQSDVFDNPPETEGYTPLRRISLVTWENEANARVLTSAQDVLELESMGELTTQKTEIIVNMPFMTWQGGKR